MIDRRVAILIHHAAKQGGLEHYAARTAAAFADRGYCVSVFTQGRPPQQARPDVSYVGVNCPGPLSVVKLWQFDWGVQKVLKQNPHEIVFAFDRVRYQTHLRAGNGVHAAYLQQRALIDPWYKQVASRLNPLHRSLLHFERIAFEHAGLQRVFTNSQMVRDQVLRFYRTPSEKISVVHNGVNWTAGQVLFDRWLEGRQSLLTEAQLPKSDFYLLFVGHGYRRKGLSFLLQGLATIADPSLHLLVVGKDREQSQFQTLAVRLGLEKRVHFFGPRADVSRFYQAADALVVPSLYDPFANVTVEGLAHGLYTVSSRYNGGSEVIHASNGTVIENLQSPESVAEALREAIKRPKTQVSAESIRASVRHLDFSNQLKQLIDLTVV